MEKKYKIVSRCLCVVLGVLVFIFGDLFTENNCERIGELVGAVMLVFGADEILQIAFAKKWREEGSELLNACITVFLGVIVFFRIGKHEDELVITCTIWAIWSILREGEEIYKKIVRHVHNVPVIVLNAIESVAVVVLSLELLMEAGVHHVHMHVLLLGAELILEAVWPLLNEACNRLRRLRAEKQSHKQAQAEVEAQAEEKSYEQAQAEQSAQAEAVCADAADDTDGIDANGAERAAQVQETDTEPIGENRIEEAFGE